MLITTGIRPISEYFATLPGTPVGVINWNDHAPKTSTRLSNNKLKNKLHALVRRRKFASLEHLCSSHDLLYADIHKLDSAKLHSTLTHWQCDLVITSRCSFVPSEALPKLSHGAINIHPSWLPSYRGGEPILSQILDNQTSLATSIHRLTDEYDKGPVLAQIKTDRPHAISKDTLSNITDGVLGQELLCGVIETLIKNPNFQGIEQPTKSPSRYARTETPESIGSKIPIDSFSAQSLWDLLNYFGYCPHEWLTLSAWQKQLQWRPIRWRELKKATEKTKWQVRNGGSVVYLQSDQATIELRPKYSSFYRLLRK